MSNRKKVIRNKTRKKEGYNSFFAAFFLGLLDWIFTIDFGIAPGDSRGVITLSHFSDKLSDEGKRKQKSIIIFIGNIFFLGFSAFFVYLQITGEPHMWIIALFFLLLDIAINILHKKI